MCVFISFKGLFLTIYAGGKPEKSEKNQKKSERIGEIRGKIGKPKKTRKSEEKMQNPRKKWKNTGKTGKSEKKQQIPRKGRGIQEKKKKNQ